MSRRSLITCLAALTSLATIPTTQAQSIIQPTSNTSITSFSGQGSIPFRFSPSSSGDGAVSSINVELVQDGINYQLANGLLSSSGDDGLYQAVFAPTSGFCGQLNLRVTENIGNSTSSRDPTTLPITITCGPVQRTRSLLSARQEQGGPSGTLNTPTGGTSYTSPDDSISIAYTPVTEGGQTFAIDAALTSDSGNFTLTQGLWKQNSSEQISASFAIPSNACGAFNLIITEHQFFQNGAIQFQSAAPSINITCPSGSGANTTVPIGGGGANATTTMTNSTMPTSTTGVNATSTSLNSTTSTSSISSTATSSAESNITSGLTNATITPTSAIVLPTNVTTTLTSTLLNATSTSLATTNSSTSMTSTANNATTTILSPNSTSTSTAPTFTGNITLPIETSTITSPTTIVSTVTTTFTQSGQTGTVTSVVTTTVSPSSSSASSNSTRTSNTSTSNTSNTSGGGGGGGGGSIRTTTITQTPSSSQAQNTGMTTVTVTPSTTPSSSASISRQTSTYTTTEVVVVAIPGRSSITSTRLQTVILVSQTIAAIVAPSSAAGNGGTGAAVLGMVIPWSMTLLVGAITTFALLYPAL